MDPLSISMAILTAIGSISATVKAAKSVWKAPEELESILNDLTESEIMIRDVRAYLEECEGNFAGPQVEHLQERLAESEGILDTLKISVQELLPKPENPKCVNRFAWLRARKRTRKLTKNLSQIHGHLASGLTQTEACRIKLQLRDLSSIQAENNLVLSALKKSVESTSSNMADMRQEYNDQHQALSSSVRQFSVGTSLIQFDTISDLSKPENMIENTSQGIAELQETYVGHGQALDSSIQLSDNTLHHLRKLKSPWATNTEVLQTLPPMLNESRTRIAQSSMITGASHSSVTYNRQSSTGLQEKISAIYASYQSCPSIEIQSRYQPPSFCMATCRCHCHEKHMTRTPSFLSRILGQVFVGYKGLPLVTGSCTESTCKRAAHPSIYVTYYFPRWWIISRIMILAGSWGTRSRPAVALSFPRLVPRGSKVLSYAQIGNMDGIRFLFLGGQASPHDIEEGEGTSVIHYALRARQWNMFKYLFHMGADVDVMDRYGRTVKSRACELLLIGTLPTEFGEWLAEAVLWTMVDEFGFSCLHETVLGLRHTNLSAEISSLITSSGTINDQDGVGSTPLWWACARGDHHTALLLLQAGANPNIANNDGKTPLHVSIRHGNLECVNELLNFGATDVVDNRGWTTLHLVVWQGQPFTESFLDKLFHRGVNLQARTKVGTSSLYIAIQKNNHTALRWLLSHGAGYKHTLNSSNILHILAWCADMESMKIIREASFSNIDIHQEDFHTETPMDCIRDPVRPDPASSELIEYFEQLLREIEERTNAEFYSPSEEKVLRNSELADSSAGLNITRLSINEGENTKVESPMSLDNSDEDDLVFHDSVEAQSGAVDLTDN